MTGLMRIPAAVAPAALVLALGSAVALLGTPPRTAAALVVVATVAALAALWAVMNLEWFVVVAVLATMVIPTALVEPAGAQVATADLLLVLAFGAWLVRAGVGAAAPPWVSGNPLLAPALAFTAVTAASLAWSVSLPMTVKATVQAVEIVVLVTLLFASIPSSVAAVRRGLFAYVGVTCILAAVVVAVFAPRALAGSVSPQYLPGLHKNALGSFLGVGLVLAYGLWLGERSRRSRRLLGLACAIELAGLSATVSRGAIAGAFVGVAAASLLLRRHRLSTFGVAVAVAAVFTVAIDAPVTAEKEQAGGYETSIVRTYSFDNAIEKIAARPLLGTGAGTYWDYIPQLEIGLADPNNVFLLTWAELGIAGLAALLFLLHRFGRLFVGARRLGTTAAVPAVAAGGGAVSLLVHFQVDSTWTRGTATLCFALMGLMVALIRLAPAAARAVAPATPPPLTAGPSGSRDVAGTSRAPAAEIAAPVSAPRSPGGPPLRVLHLLTSDAFAGIERHVVRLARELRARGCAAELACPPTAVRLRAEAAAAGIPVHPPTGGRPRAWPAALARGVAADPPDVIHLHDGRSAIAAALLGPLSGAVIVRTQHFARPASVGRTGWRREASLALHRTLNRKLDGYVAVSRSVADGALERRDAGRLEIAVIPPGIEVPDAEAVARAQAERERLADPVVAFLGRLEAEKRVDLLIEAIPHVLRQLPSCRFVIAGSGGVEPQMRQLAGSLGVAGAITWTGEVAEPAVVLERAHVYVNPSSTEGFGLATVEAMALGLPVVAAASGASGEIVEDGVTGLLVPDEDPRAVATAIVRLAGDRRLAARMAAEARGRAAARYGVDRTAELTLDLYRRLRAGAGS